MPGVGAAEICLTRESAWEYRMGQGFTERQPVSWRGTIGPNLRQTARAHVAPLQRIRLEAPEPLYVRTSRGTAASSSRV
jgi:hypothetical protein